jgi:ferredoxin, 2Fe-2S
MIIDFWTSAQHRYHPYGMPKIAFIQPNGARADVELVPGNSLMQLAINAGVPGILGECGGCAQCATCHVYVAEGAEALPVVTEAEDALLECTVSERKAGSRLSCQLQAVPELEGLVVNIPPRQI